MSSLQAMAQENCFEFDDEGKTIIGLTGDGISAEELTIPAQVTAVSAYALADRSASLATLVVDGGDPAFDSNVWGENSPSSLTLIRTGSNMSQANIKALLMSIGSMTSLSTVEMDGYKGEYDSELWSGSDIENILTNSVQVVLPAELVSDQVFGDASVYGSFTMGETQELKTFCGNVTFYDENDGSNFLFYVPTEFRQATGQVYIQRVHYVMAGEGVVMHHITGSTQTVWLPRYDGDVSTDDALLYAQNMLVGVTTPTEITETEGDKTNFVLYQGRFRPTSGGILGAHRAYLQINTTSLGSMSREFSMTTEEVTAIDNVRSQQSSSSSEWFDLSGRRVKSPKDGVFIYNGKKVRR